MTLRHCADVQRQRHGPNPDLSSYYTCTPKTAPHRETDMGTAGDRELETDRELQTESWRQGAGDRQRAGDRELERAGSHGPDHMHSFSNIYFL